MSLGELNDVAGWYAERLLIDCSSVASSLNVPIIFLCEKSLRYTYPHLLGTRLKPTSASKLDFMPCPRLMGDVLAVEAVG